MTYHVYELIKATIYKIAPPAPICAAIPPSAIPQPPKEAEVVSLAGAVGRQVEHQRTGYGSIRGRGVSPPRDRSA